MAQWLMPWAEWVQARISFCSSATFFPRTLFTVFTVTSSEYNPSGETKKPRFRNCAAGGVQVKGHWQWR